MGRRLPRNCFLTAQSGCPVLRFVGDGCKAPACCERDFPVWVFENSWVDYAVTPYVPQIFVYQNTEDSTLSFKCMQCINWSIKKCYQDQEDQGKLQKASLEVSSALVSWFVLCDCGCLTAVPEVGGTAGYIVWQREQGYVCTKTCWIYWGYKSWCWSRRKENEFVAKDWEAGGWDCSFVTVEFATPLSCSFLLFVWGWQPF